MEKTIMIDGKQIRFKSTGALPMRYKAQYQRDFFGDLFRLSALEKLKKIKEGKAKSTDFDMVDFDFFYNTLWVLAKTADKDIPDPISWLDTFEIFPILDIIPELMDILMSSIQTKKNKTTMNNFVSQKK